ncbi:MAG: DUF1592 domain-containing protein [Planctomycetota bacterium]
MARPTQNDFRYLLQLRILTLLRAMMLLALICPSPSAAQTDPVQPADSMTLSEAKLRGREASKLLASGRNLLDAKSQQQGPPTPRLAEFESEIKPLLQQHCVDCHGPDEVEGNIRIDSLDPNLFAGPDVAWWLEVLAVLTKGEMPPEEGELSGEDRSKIINWFTNELHQASKVRRSEQGHSSFRRMTRYEYNYALQDLLGLELNFASDLPPDPIAEDGFQNSAANLQLSASQFETYRQLALNALNQATVRGSQPTPVYWSMTFGKFIDQRATDFENERKKKEKRFADDPEKLKQEIEKLERSFSRLGGAHYFDQNRKIGVRPRWGYGGAKHAWASQTDPPSVPPTQDTVLILPPGGQVIVELGNQVPETGTLRIRARARRTLADEDAIPVLSWEYGFQASNNSSASAKIVDKGLSIDAFEESVIYEWDFPIGELKCRNPMRTISPMGKTPSPSEYLKLRNSTINKGIAHIDYIEVTAPAYASWPPPSHKKIFGEVADPNEIDASQAAGILRRFMRRAWRREIGEKELQQKLTLYEILRNQCADSQEAMVETLATVLASPKFLYVSASRRSSGKDTKYQSVDSELASRLSFFLWCSIPDEELLRLAAEGNLKEPARLRQQVRRMLNDPRSRRFSDQFVSQWLGMQLLDYLEVDSKFRMDEFLRSAMREEPKAFFHQVLQENDSAMSFLHADFMMLNDRLARHYGIPDIHGHDFRPVGISDSGSPNQLRGGLLTQAGLLAMNSDGKDSHPLKRGIWLLSSILDSPPPPPPPAVPEIDIADPAIAEMTLKERLEDHRNDPACISCHAKIDPWGIAFENYDAIGLWRTNIEGKPVDASSELVTEQRLDGMQGLKQFLLLNRQDQFSRALVTKMTTFAIGRPLRFEDRAVIDELTLAFRRREDRLAELVQLIVSTELFQLP